MGGCLSTNSCTESLGCNVSTAAHPLPPAEKQQHEVPPHQHRSAATAEQAQDVAAKTSEESKETQCLTTVELAAAPPTSAMMADPVLAPADVVLTPVIQAEVMQQVRAVLQGFSSITADGSRSSLGRAAAVLLWELQQCGVDTVILTAAAPMSSACVLAGCAGVGAVSLQQQHQQLMLADPNFSAALCCTQGEEQPYLYQTAGADDLAPDWAALHQQHGLSSFLAMQVGEPGETVGVLTLASLRPAAFTESWWWPLLDMLSSGLVRLLGHPLMAGMCRIAHEVEALHTDDYREYVTVMLQRSAALLESITDMRLAVRLGLLSSDEQWLVVQHLDSDAAGSTAAEQSAAYPEGSPAAAAAPAAHGELRQVKLAARGTICCEAFAAHAPRMVYNTSKYSEALARPAADVCLCGDSEASLVVVPLQLAPDVPCKAALYVLHDKPGNFASAKRPICVLASMLRLLLHKQLQEGGLLAAVWQGGPVQAVDQVPSDRHSLGPLVSLGPVQSSTASTMVQILQQQVRNNVLASQTKLLQAAQRKGYIEDLELDRVLGKGGFGIVYAGRWKGCPAAIKVMMVPKQQRGVMKGAMEMAVQESLSHPNIVRVFACLFDMAEEAVSYGGSTSSGASWVGTPPMFNPSSLRFRPASPADVEAGAISNIMVLEYCEGGTLASAVRAGLMHETEQLHGRTVVSVTMWRLLTVLLDVARSLEHVHRMSLLHCDLKPANVLLKTSPDSPLGLVAKLADFGLVKMMTNDRLYIRNQSVSGTITHLAPERYETGSRLTPAVDIYAFGMLMFEAYTRHRPFANLNPAGILQAVARGSRPEFPAGTPLLYSALAQACWAQEAEQRPLLYSALAQACWAQEAEQRPLLYSALAQACWAQEAEQRPSASELVQQLQDMLARTNSPSVFAKRRV